MAVADAIYSPEWLDRCYLFNGEWDDGEQVAEFRNGSGDVFTVTFAPAGAYLRGFDHESALSPWRLETPAVWPGLLQGLPDALRPYADEPAFTAEGVPEVTLALWWQTGSAAWSFGSPMGDADDGGVWLFDQVDGSPQTYAEYVREYFEVEPDLDCLRRILAGEPITDRLVTTLNPDVTLEMIVDDLRAMGVAVAGVGVETSADD